VRRAPTWLAVVVTGVLAIIHVAGEAQMSGEYSLAAMPDGYQLQAYDDCGVPGRQPHITTFGGVHEYSPAAVNADEKARTVAWEWHEVRATYEGLQPGMDYVLAITYANEPYNPRVQSLWAGELQLHGPHPLPKGGAERLLFRLPRETYASGVLNLGFRMEATVNAVVSAIELWAPAPSPTAVHLGPPSTLIGDIHGEVLDLRYDPLADAQVELREEATGRSLLTTRTDTTGHYQFARDALDAAAKPDAMLELVASNDGVEDRRAIAPEERHFEPLRYRPIPTRQSGLARAEVSLDGPWLIHPEAVEDARKLPLDADGWKPFSVPGQWVQQGYDLPRDRAVAVAREVAIPAAWRGRRIILRFDAIHAGTDYWLNGTHLGRSENLFTPVEWDVTDAARVGEMNRLDLAMTEDTLSEALSYSSGYAFHSLGGIDRKVCLYALPPVHVSRLRIDAGLDDRYEDGELKLALALANTTGAEQAGLSLLVSLIDSQGKAVEQSQPHLETGTRRGGHVGPPLHSPSGGVGADPCVCPLAPVPPGDAPEGSRELTYASRVPRPLQWSAEKPNLYLVRIDLRQGRKLVERIEREIGFRRIEVRGSQLHVNGRRVKLAGACRHEIDPLTGRANTACHAETDAQLLKGANLNYVRTSHYPPTDEFLEAADRLGLYVEVEAPFCWVGNDSDPSHLRAVLEPTSAMIDACHAHPSVIMWSLANESQFNPLFEVSAQLCKQLDPTRPTTFNNPDPKRLCDIANLHYAPVPYDQHLQGDPRPILLGEYNFPVCHEQTDVRIDPGLRELWGLGHSDAGSPWGRRLAEQFTGPPGTPPGAWQSIVDSDRVIGGAIWAAFDEPFYLPDGQKVGYAWHHGFWGLIDAWRRPKPEWWLSKLIHSPVAFPSRQVDFAPGTSEMRLPVRNEYSFTDLTELRFTWELHDRQGSLDISAAPGETAQFAIPVPPGTQPGEVALVRVHDARGELVTVAAIQLGERPREPLPQPTAGPPARHEEGGKLVIEGESFGIVLDKASGRVDAEDRRHTTAVLGLPMLHVTRFDFGDLGPPNVAPYEVLPHAETRVVKSVSARGGQGALVLTIEDAYEGFTGSVTWEIDRLGVGRIGYDYTYHGEPLYAREIGVRIPLRSACDELTWRRWSEWGEYPADSISRTEGRAKARRDAGSPLLPESTRPTWPWSLDETELGTNDFRGVKLNIYEAALLNPEGEGLRVGADADAHVRACLDQGAVLLHLLSECRLGPVTLRDGDRLTGRFVVELSRGGATDARPRPHE